MFATQGINAAAPKRCRSAPLHARYRLTIRSIFQTNHGKAYNATEMTEEHHSLYTYVIAL